jgi:TusA-related sulfurtransferase
VTAELDLREFTCPMTWVRTKLALEAMAPGEAIVVLLPPGQAMEDVPRSAREAGHEVTVRDGGVRVVRR